jgi:hypothetical protein
MSRPRFDEARSTKHDAPRTRTQEPGNRNRREEKGRPGNGSRAGVEEHTKGVCVVLNGTSDRAGQPDFADLVEPVGAIEPDFDEAERFLAALDPTAATFTFQTFDDNADRKDEKLAGVWVGTLRGLWSKLRRYNKSAGVFVTVNETDGKGRAAKNIERVRAVFVDLDGAPLPGAFHVEPHVVVESSPGRWHLYWLVRDCSRDEFAPLQKRLAAHYGGDKAVHDLPRVMRLPGFVHRKRKPFRSRLVEAHDHLIYSVEEVAAGLQIVDEAKAHDGNGGDRSEGSSAGWQQLFDNIRGGRELHDSLRDLAAKMIARGMPDSAVVTTLRAFMEGSRAKIDTPDRWRSRYDDIPNLVESARKFGKKEAPIPEFSTNWWCDVKQIPRRRWLYGQHYIRGHASATIADGGMGKSTLAIIEGICIAIGKEMLGVPVNEQCRVWYWNGEEPRAEIARRVHAVCAHHKVDPYELARTFRFTSGLDEFPIKIATATQRGVTVDEALVEKIIAFIRENGIGLMIVDPFISCHGVPENDNNAVDIVAKTWARIAAETGCAVDLNHHTRKPMRGDNGDVLAADARGAGALIHAVRSSRVFNQMTEKEAGAFDVGDRFEFFRVNRGKVNMVRRGGGAWYRLVSVNIGNSDAVNAVYGDNVQTVVAWTPPESPALKEVTTAHMHAVRAKVAAGEYRRDWRTGNRWVGAVIAEVVGLDPKRDRAEIEQIIRSWIEDRGVIKEVSRWDAKVRKDRVFVEPGDIDPGGGE